MCYMKKKMQAGNDSSNISPESWLAGKKPSPYMIVCVCVCVRARAEQNYSLSSVYIFGRVFVNFSAQKTYMKKEGAV